MPDRSHGEFTARQYASRANEYVASVNHSTGDDLLQLEHLVRGCPSARVLDLGCGGGHVSYRVAPHVHEVVACDITPAMLEAVTETAAARGLPNITVTQAAAEQLPFDNASFDFVVCRFSAHHWHNLEAGLREARRVLKTGGQAIWIDAVAPADPLLDTHLQAFELLRDPSHVRNYSVAEWVGALARSGFTCRGITARKLRMEFPVWIARTAATPEQASAIQSLQAGAPESVRTHFAIAADGSFDLDTITIEVVPD